MKTVNEPNTLLYWNDELVKVVGISNGKVIHMSPVNAQRCESCGVVKEISVIENSPLFQENAKPVETIKE